MIFVLSHSIANQKETNKRVQFIKKICSKRQSCEPSFFLIYLFVFKQKSLTVNAALSCAIELQISVHSASMHYFVPSHLASPGADYVCFWPVWMVASSLA